MKNLFIYSFTVFLLSSCAGTLTHVHMLEHGGAIRTESVTDQDYQYKVFIKNTTDFGWNGDRKEDRLIAVNLMFKEKCKKIEIIDETPIQTGTYMINRPAVTWVIKVKCEK